LPYALLGLFPGAAGLLPKPGIWMERLKQALAFPMYAAAEPDHHAIGAGLGAGIAMMLPQVANAVAVTESDVTVMTPDGMADCYFVHPATGTAPGVLMWPDIFGLRPAFRQMGKRLAESGYSVLVVNPFYRVQKAPTAPAGAKTPIADVRPLAQQLSPRPRSRGCAGRG